MTGAGLCGLRIELILGSDPLVARRLQFVETRRGAAHTAQNHFVPAPSTDTRATTGATLADHRTTVAIVDVLFMASPPRECSQRTGC